LEIVSTTPLPAEVAISTIQPPTSNTTESVHVPGTGSGITKPQPDITITITIDESDEISIEEEDSKEIPIKPTSSSEEESKETSKPASESSEEDLKVSLTLGTADHKNGRKVSLNPDALEIDPQSADADCVNDDVERYRRSVLGATYSRLDGEPTLLTFVEGSSCVASFKYVIHSQFRAHLPLTCIWFGFQFKLIIFLLCYRKSGHHDIHNLRRMFPEFPENTNVEAAGFLDEKLLLIDSTKGI
jgi:hypothetical protein